MYVYIDEAGNFAQQSSSDSRFDLVAALVVPEVIHDRVINGFIRLRESWNGGTGTEVKGSKLTAEQARDVISLLAQHDVVLEFIALDMATHSPATLSDFKLRTADAIVANITAEHHENAVAYLTDLRDRVAKMSDQLFVQFKLTVDLVLKTLELATLYYVQREPSELGSFRWVIDRKDRSLTDMEDLWRKLVMPYGEARYATESFFTLPNADYSYFNRFRVNAANPKWKAHLQFMRRTYGARLPSGAIDAKLVLAEHQEFADSATNAGVQIVDIVATTLRRAFNNRLEQLGWDQLGRLIIERNSPMFVQLGQPATPVPEMLSGHVADVCNKISRRAKQMASAPLSRYFGKESPGKANQVPVRSTKIGRNVLCPCDSGKKYKKCCGI